MFKIFSNICIWCKRLYYIIKNKKLRIKNTRIFFSPNKKKNFVRIQDAKKLIKKKCSRAKKKIIYLENSLNEVKNKMKQISQSTLDELLKGSNISNSQSNLIHEIFSAAKIKNPKNRRYSENWMLLCMLLQIRHLCWHK